MVVLLGQDTTECGDTCAHHVHRVRRRGQAFQCLFHRDGQATQCLEFGFVGAQLGCAGQFAVHQQVGNLLELAHLGDVQNVVATVVQVVAGFAHRAQRGVACGDA